MKFQELNTVRVVITGSARTGDIGIVMKGNESAFGETYWIAWDDGKVSLMHGDNLEKANVDIQAEKP